MKNLFKGLTIFAIYAVLAVLIIGVIDFGFEFATKIMLPNVVSITVGVIIITLIIIGTVEMTLREVEGNTVLATVDILFPQELVDGQTAYNIYHTGFHFVWWWEKDGPIVNLETDISERVHPFTISTETEDITLSFQFDVEPDPYNISNYILNGKDTKEREENIALRVITSLKRGVEIFCSRYESGQILQDEDGLISGENGLQRYLESIVEDESELLGIRIKKIRIGDINYSEAVSKARNDKKTMEKRLEAATMLAKGLGISREAALERIQVDDGKVSAFKINAPEGFTSFWYGGGGGSSAGMAGAVSGGSGKSKQSTRKR